MMDLANQNFCLRLANLEGLHYSHLYSIRKFGNGCHWLVTDVSLHIGKASSIEA
jgi:hypothetical protein